MGVVLMDVVCQPIRVEEWYKTRCGNKSHFIKSSNQLIHEIKPQCPCPISKSKSWPENLERYIKIEKKN